MKKKKKTLLAGPWGRLSSWWSVSLPSPGTNPPIITAPNSIWVLRKKERKECGLGIKAWKIPRWWRAGCQWDSSWYNGTSYQWGGILLAELRWLCAGGYSLASADIVRHDSSRGQSRWTRTEAFLLLSGSEMLLSVYVKKCHSFPTNTKAT